MQACRLYVYEFDPAPFKPKIAEAGYWVTREEVAPLSIIAVGDLLTRHFEAGIELRIVINLWPLIDAIVASGLEFSIIRKANAQPHLASTDASAWGVLAHPLALEAIAKTVQPPSPAPAKPAKSRTGLFRPFLAADRPGPLPYGRGFG